MLFYRCKLIGIIVYVTMVVICCILFTFYIYVYSNTMLYAIINDKVINNLLLYNIFTTTVNTNNRTNS